MSLSRLPPEVLYCVAKLLRNGTLNALILTNRYFAEALWPCLYDDEIQFRRKPRRKLQGYGASSHRFTRFIGLWKSDIMLGYLRGKSVDALSQYDFKEKTLFQHVIFAQNLRVAKILLANGVDVNTGEGGRLVRGKKQTFLHLRELYRLPQEVPLFLIDHGADIMATYDGVSAYIEVAKRGTVTVLERVLSRLKIHQENSNSNGGYLPANYIDRLFHCVLYMGGVEKARLLLDQGANHSLELNWCTPLMKAIAGGNDDIVNLLLDASADITLVDRDGIPPYGATVLSAAEITKCKNSTVRRLIKTVVDNGGDITIPGSRIAEVGSAREILSITYPWSQYYFTPLHHFVRAGNLTIVKALIQSGAVAKATPQKIFHILRDSQHLCRYYADKRINRNIFCEIFIALRDRPDFDLGPVLNGKTVGFSCGNFLDWMAYCSVLMYRPYPISFIREVPGLCPSH